MSATTVGWKRPELWSAKGARQQLRRMIEASIAARVAARQNTVTIVCSRLERRRQQLLTAARQLSEASSTQQRDALTQAMLGYFRDQGELERKCSGVWPRAGNEASLVPIGSAGRFRGIPVVLLGLPVTANPRVVTETAVQVPLADRGLDHRFDSNEARLVAPGTLDGSGHGKGCEQQSYAVATMLTIRETT